MKSALQWAKETEGWDTFGGSVEAFVKSIQADALRHSLALLTGSLTIGAVLDRLKSEADKLEA